MKKLTFLSFALLSTLAGCKWTEFDDLSDSTWVHSTTKPDVKSADYGLALTPAKFTGDGGAIVVIGTDPPTYSALEYDSGGGTTLGEGVFDLNKQAAVSSIPDQPIVLGDATSGLTVLVTALGDGRIIVTGGTDPTKPGTALIEEDATPGGATLAPPAAGKTEPIVLVSGVGTTDGTGNFHTVLTSANMFTSCNAFDADGTTKLSTIALATAPAIGPNGAVIAWTQTGTVVAYDLAAAVACVKDGVLDPLDPTVTGWPTTSLDVSALAGSAFVPVVGQISILGDHFALLGGHTDPTKDDKGQVITLDLDTGTVIGTPLITDGLRGFAVGELADNNTYLAIGFPERTVDGTVSGAVEVHALDITKTDSIINASVALNLNDAQPDANEKFGRSITFTSFNDKGILVVGADNEIFSYYETLLYPDTRK